MIDLDDAKARKNVIDSFHALLSIGAVTNQLEHLYKQATLTNSHDVQAVIEAESKYPLTTTNQLEQVKNFLQQGILVKPFCKLTVMNCIKNTTTAGFTLLLLGNTQTDSYYFTLLTPFTVAIGLTIYKKYDLPPLSDIESPTSFEEYRELVEDRVQNYVEQWRTEIPTAVEPHLLLPSYYAWFNRDGTERLNPAPINVVVSSNNLSLVSERLENVPHLGITLKEVSKWNSSN
jgi:hypothetical protein